MRANTSTLAHTVHKHWENDTFRGNVCVDCVVICLQCAVRDRGAAVHLSGRAAGGQQGGRVRNVAANVSCQHLARCYVPIGFQFNWFP